jgi:hypothetical protein
MTDHSEIELSNPTIIPFIACPLYHTGTNFKLTEEELGILISTGLHDVNLNFDKSQTGMSKQTIQKKYDEKPANFREAEEHVKVSDNHTVLDLPGMERVRTFIVTFVRNYIKETLQISNEFYLTQSWWTENKKDSRHHTHHHPNTLLSLVYYVHAESGDLVAHSPTYTMFPNFDFNWDIIDYNYFNSKSWSTAINPSRI